MAAALVADLFRIWLTLPMLLSLTILTQLIGAQDPTPSTVSVFLPSYGPRDWAALRGSIISSNDAETAYTIFCAPDRIYSCNIGGDTLLPFTFIEGPSTYHYEQSVDSTISVTQACLLSNTTVAICSGSTSLGAITLGPLSGPSSTSVAPFTLTDSSIHWGVLTLATPPLTSVAGGLTFTYYSSGVTGLASAPEPTASAAVATTTDSIGVATGATNSPSAQLEDTSGAGKLVIVGFTTTLLVSVLLW
ncbi:uncharacterized protein GGS22DRAFT_103761 [Annulohypoxylon maeteangense]|uniref:uncharacterized protein n=1 Tax=Annulohypoxylon maeteangense TaxID=1927788 RepID=UPI0020088B9E|nr:uncharacterized protein GGS22DRAFT_103761 [Annulohypoxylon maeteangense]KAI0879826.1 hypothetical protein GGS22DRAFT_103761 [Annulohypoxylon maeteangense]